MAALVLFALITGSGLTSAEAGISGRDVHRHEDGSGVGATTGRLEFDIPVSGEVVRAFDPPERRWLAGHRGVDLQVDIGHEVRAAGAGVVAFAGIVVDRPVVSIDHSIGIRTTYEAITPTVSQGQLVKTGQVIGTLATGNDHCSEPCLHWGARIGRDVYIDPMKLLQPPTIRLYRPEPW